MRVRAVGAVEETCASEMFGDQAMSSPEIATTILRARCSKAYYSTQMEPKNRKTRRSPLHSTFHFCRSLAKMIKPASFSDVVQFNIKEVSQNDTYLYCFRFSRNCFVLDLPPSTFQRRLAAFVPFRQTNRYTER